MALFEVAPAAAREGFGLVLASTSEQVLDEHAHVSRALTLAELRRCRALSRPEARRAYVAAHVLVRVCAARVSGIDPAAVTLVQRCPRCQGAHGRPQLPELPDLGVALSHAGDSVAAAAAWGPVGVDIEELSSLRSCEAVEVAALSVRERLALPAYGSARREAVLRQWVRKEALVKAGAAELDGLARIDLSQLPADAQVRARRGATGRWRGWEVRDWAAPGLAGAAVSGAPLALEVAVPVTPSTAN